MPADWGSVWLCRWHTLAATDERVIAAIPCVRRGRPEKARELLQEFGITPETWNGDLWDPRLTPTMADLILNLSGERLPAAYATASTRKMNSFHAFIVAQFRKLNVRYSREIEEQVREEPELEDIVPNRLRNLLPAELAALGVIIAPAQFIAPKRLFDQGAPPGTMLGGEIRSLVRILARYQPGGLDRPRMKGDVLKVPWPPP